jgi:hypothetical protein
VAAQLGAQLADAFFVRALSRKKREVVAFTHALDYKDGLAPVTG